MINHMFIGFSFINHLSWGTSIYGIAHMKNHSPTAAQTARKNLTTDTAGEARDASRIADPPIKDLG